MSTGNGFAEDTWQMTDRRTSTFLQRWGGPIGTVASVVLSLFLLWHQIDMGMRLQAAQITALQAQIAAMQIQIERMESRIYDLTAESAKTATR